MWDTRQAINHDFLHSGPRDKMQIPLFFLKFMRPHNVAAHKIRSIPAWHYR